jgi:tetratricopeptide (TPR) repeat protein
MVRLGRAVLQQGRVDDAEHILREAVAAYRLAFPPGDSNITHPLNELAFLYRDRQRRYADAETLFREAVDINRRATPTNHYELAKNLLYVGNVLSAQQKYADAEPFYRQSVAEYELAFQPNDTSLALAKTEYGIVLMRLNRLAQAESLLLESEPILRSNPPWRLYSAATITCLYAKWDQAEPGKGYNLKVREWSSKILDAYFPLNAAATDSGVKAKP